MAWGDTPLKTPPVLCQNDRIGPATYHEEKKMINHIWNYVSEKRLKASRFSNKIFSYEMQP